MSPVSIATIIRSLRAEWVREIRTHYGCPRIAAGRHTVFHNRDIEVVVWKWREDGWLPRHGHTGLCAVRVLQGRFLNADFPLTTSQAKSVVVLEKDDVIIADTDPLAGHQMKNVGPSPGLTLHLYKK
jgi:hypothetical protein